MKIVMLSFWYVEHSILLSNSLSLNHEIHLFISNNHVFKSHENQINNDVHVIKFQRETNFLKRFLNYFGIFKQVKFLNPDILWIQDGNLLFSPFLIFLRKTIKVLEVHDPIPHMGEKKFKKMLTTFIFTRLVSKIIVHGRKQKNILKNIYFIPFKDIKYFPLGLHTLYDFGNNYQLKHQILFFGRLYKYKGLDLFIESQKYLKNKYSNLKFIVAGKGENIGKYLKGITDKSNLIFYNDYIKNEFVEKLFKESLAIILPYKSATQSGVLFTSMAFNKPVVVTNIPDISEIVLESNAGYILKETSAIELANGIDQVLSNYENYISSIDTKDFTYDKITTSIIKWLND